MHLNLLPVILIGTWKPFGGHVPRALTVCAVMLNPIAAQSQMNNTDGAWQGSVSCSELQVASSRSGKAFTSPVSVSVSLGAMTGKRENAQVTESFTGSIERSGRATFEGSGHWKDDPNRSWRYRLRGTQNGAQMKLTGPMESQDGKTKLRDCRLELSKAAMERKAQAAITKPAPADNTTVASPAQAREAAARAVAAKLQADESAATTAAATAAAKANAAELESIRQKNLQLEAAKLTAERAAAESKKAPIKAKSAMDL